MTTWACTVAVETMGRALTAEEHQRFTRSTLELWNAGHPPVVYTLTALGREALAECVDCFDDAEPGSMMCARCESGHVTPDRSDLRLAGAA